MRFLIAFAAALALAPPAHAQVTLHAGDTYAISFSTLPDSSVGYFGAAPAGGFVFRLSDFDVNTDQLEFHLFEETPNDLSVAGGVAESITDGTSLPDAFADFDGGALFTMLAGSVTLEEITFLFQEPVDEINSLRHTLTVVPLPVPEPDAAALLIIATLGAVLAWKRGTIRVSSLPAQ